MKVQVEKLKVCNSCAEIVAQGYTDSIDDCEKHQALCNHIDKKVLPAGHYWLEGVESIDTDYAGKCECCGAGAPNLLVKHAINVECETNYLLAVQQFAAVLGSVSRNEMQDMYDYQHAVATDLAVNAEKRRIAKVLAALLKKELEQY